MGELVAELGQYLRACNLQFVGQEKFPAYSQREWRVSQFTGAPA
jgi:hypothetical protein